MKIAREERPNPIIGPLMTDADMARSLMDNIHDAKCEYLDQMREFHELFEMYRDKYKHNPSFIDTLFLMLEAHLISVEDFDYFAFELDL